jgi:hypothetical protein
MDKVDMRSNAMIPCVSARFKACSHSSGAISPMPRGLIERITVVGVIPDGLPGLSHGDKFIKGNPDKSNFLEIGN